VPNRSGDNRRSSITPRPFAHIIYRRLPTCLQLEASQLSAHPGWPAAAQPPPPEAQAEKVAFQDAAAAARMSLQGFQVAAAHLARAKFAGSFLPAMVAGCALMAAAVGLHVLVLARCVGVCVCVCV